MEAPENGFNPSELVNALIAKIDAADYYGIAYNSAIVDAIVHGQASIIGKYLNDELTLKIDLAEGVATLVEAEGETQFPLNQEEFAAKVQSYRDALNGEKTGLDPNELTNALYAKLAPKARYFSVYAAAVEKATIFGNAVIFGRSEDQQYDLVINHEYLTAGLYLSDILVAGYDIDAGSFAALKEVFFSEEE